MTEQKDQKAYEACLYLYIGKNLNLLTEEHLDELNKQIGMKRFTTHMRKQMGLTAKTEEVFFEIIKHLGITYCVNSMKKDKIDTTFIKVLNKVYEDHKDKLVE